MKRRVFCHGDTPILGRCLVVFGVCLGGFDVGLARAQSSCAIAARDETTVTASGSERPLPAGELRRRATELRARLARATDDRDRAHLACVVAEVLKQVGDPQAVAYYRQAVSLQPSNAEYHLLYGDYLRNYRGPGQPLIGAAAELYYEGLRRARASTDQVVANQIRRSLIALYERDGVSLADGIDQRRPRFFFSSLNTGAQSPDDPGVVDGIRLRASGAYLAQSVERLGRPLSSSENQALIRNTWRGQTLQRFRARFGSTAVDAYFEGHVAADSQPVSFRELTTSVDATVGFAGVGVEQIVDLYPAFDVMVRGDIKWGSRTGLIEFVPDANESTRLIVGRAVASRFVGPDKINFEVTAAHDEITPHVTNPTDRGVDVVGVIGRYQIFRPLLGSKPYGRPIASRGSEVFVGTTKQTEMFGTVGVDKRDLFFGASLKGLPGGGAHSFDVTVQPTVFKFERRTRVPGGTAVDPLANKQFETFVTVLYRLIDRENVRSIDSLPPLVFLNLVGVFSVGEARTGPTQFDRTRIGAQLDAKVVGRQHGGVTWLMSGRYELQDFTALGRRKHVVGGSLSMGF